MKHIFNKITSVLFLFFTLVSFTSFAQTTVSGTVKDANGEALVGINVIVKGTITGAPTNLDGKFSFTTNTPLPFKVQVSGVGFQTKLIDVTSSGQNLDVTLDEQVSVTDQVVVTASRVEEGILQSPVSIEKMDILAVKNTAADNFYDGLANMKGVDLVPSSMLIKMVNARGFGGPYQTRFVQRFDGMDMQSPSLSIPFGNIAGIHDIDVESVEVQPGAASALYGPNAFNGVMNMTSKNPFFYQGLTAQLKGGVNNVGNEEIGASPYFEVALRYGKAINEKFAYKVNFSYLTAKDWAGNDQRLLTPSAANPAINDVSNQVGGTNGNFLNTYGDETFAFEVDPTDPTGMRRIPLVVGGVPIRRTGYKESDLTNYDVQNLRADLTLYYRLTNNIEASYMIKYSDGNGVLTGSNRYSYRPQYVINKFELKGSNFFLRAYNMDQRMGEGSFDLIKGAGRLVQSKPDATWAQEYRNAFSSNGGNHDAARAVADQGRLQPGTPAFNSALDLVKKNKPVDGGEAFIEEGRITHVEGQYDFTKLLNDVVGVTLGASYRRFQVESDGTIFDDAGEKGPVNYYDIGAYIQATKSFADMFKIVASARYDKSQYFDGQITPRASLVFSPTKNHNIRASYQTGFKNPVFQEQNIFFSLGPGFILAGGRRDFLPQIHKGPRFDLATGLPAEQIEVPFIKPEQVTSMEFGYKGMITPEFFVDISYNRNTYKNFIGLNLGRLVLYAPTTPDPAAPTAVYAIYQNLPGEFNTQGISVGTNYNLNGYIIGANYTWSNLIDELPAAFLPNFNTPEHKMNITFGNRKVTKNLGFNVAFRWQSEFYYFSQLGGTSIQENIPTFNTVDAQVTYKIRRGLTAKIGGSNIFNQYYRQALGAPRIGGMYYLTLTFDQFGR